MLRIGWRDLLPYLGRPLAPISLLVAASVIASGAESIVLVMVVRAAVHTIDSGRSSTIPLLPDSSPGWMLGIAAVAALLVIALHWILASITATLATRVQVAVRSACIQSYVRAEWWRQANEGSASLQEMVGVLAPEATQLTIAMTASFSAVVSLVVLVAVALIVSPVVTVFVVLFGLMVFGVLRPLMHRFRRLAGAHIQSNGSYLAEVARTTALTMELKVFGVQERTTERLLAVDAHAAHDLERLRRSGRFSRSIYRDLAMLALVGAVFAMHSIDTLDITALGAVVLLVVRAVQGAQNVFEASTWVREVHPAMTELQRRISELTDAVEVRGDVVVDRFEHLELRDVTYHYGTEGAALDGVSLTITAGEMIGVVGPSGGGKSTLTQMLVGLRPPTSGTVTINGHDIRSLSLASLSKLVSLVPQEPELVEASILENIIFWRDGITRADAEHAARAAHVYDEITSLAAGFDTVLGPGGKGLSGGQKQRIAIARALAGRPALLVLDEPTSALDAVSESLVRESLEEMKGRVTVVVVAHRTTTVQVCDRLVRVENGRTFSD
ncbi:MAG: ATP-binding cassette domain-containing protein [Actinobacteria bacterium]|uniref:Unannotated protein n=2 Tax=freshwater metagenome TaxID=449393 RepID=A0A6J6TFH0_9ZZZZ|nr:ATP-binding cassette domain-containing protein [Actinomycetota bacterium]MSX54422.1 ATP-binding cassette domain-containing protein [Actinomycetota bacterium]MSZ84617.1 ATP-binding cassette domain-containing protein [Actinomycetota bacterium]MTB19466.1 ATP-binding cassette domain-containing protein [Actinomycetota bacterium]